MNSTTAPVSAAMLALLAAIVLSFTSVAAQAQVDELPSSDSDKATTDYPFARPIRELVKGDWSVQGCSVLFQRFSFSEDGTKMFAVPSSGFLADTINSQVREMAIYDVLGEFGRVLRMQIEDESRRTEDGRIVIWDLVLLSENSFCWHRTDWPPGGCTQPRARCSG